MTNQDALSTFFESVIEGVKQDAASKNQKVPISSFMHKESEERGQLIGADYFKYLVFGRGPGKFPPPDKMLDFVQANPQIVEDMRRVWAYTTERSAAYVIGRKIAREGTDIFSGKKPGIDFVGVMEKHMPDLLRQLAMNEAIHVITGIKQSIQ